MQSDHPDRYYDIIDRPLIKPIAEPRGPWYYFTIAVLLTIIAWGGYGWGRQLWDGLDVTGLNAPVFWGIYLANFVFFIGISHAGTLISAILRVSNAEWRRPVTRCAEVITVFALIFGAGSIITDLGRPDRLFNVIIYGRFQSPILWDVTCISTYLMSSIIYLYLPLIPDLAILRDRKIGFKWLYRILAIGYRGTENQKKWLQRGISIMAVVIIPIAVSVHTVVSYIFATTLKPGWHSTILGPYFVVGAIFSGIAALFIVMAVIRKAFHLEGILKDIHFNNLALVLLVMTCLMIYFTFNIYLVEITGNEPLIMAPVMDKVSGEYFLLFWGMIVGGLIVPAIILAFPKGRTVAGCVVASSLIVPAMWIERYLIVVPTLLNPHMPYGNTSYTPTEVEWGILAAFVAAFVLLYFLFTRFFPIISIWELHEGIDEAPAEMRKRIESYLPDGTTAPAVVPDFQPDTDVWEGERRM